MSEDLRTVDHPRNIAALRAAPVHGPKRAFAAGVDVNVQRVAKSFGARSVLRDIELYIEAQEFVALVGRSGCGKSTLLRLIAGLEQPTAGSVLIDGAPLVGVNPRARMMFQDARLLPWLRVEDNVALGKRPVEPEEVRRALDHVQLADHARDWPGTLSGGQRQRVALARALIGNPALLLLDEPLGAVDALTRIEMQQLIYLLWREQRSTAVLVTHDIEEAVTLADRVLILEGGRIGDEFAVPLSRPRDRADQHFQQLVLQVLSRVLGASLSATGHGERVKSAGAANL